MKLLRGNGLPHEDVSSKLDCIFVGEAGSRIIGIGGLEICGNSALLRSLVIEESSRGRGYGKALCSKLVEYAKLKGIDEIYLLTTTADKFFEKVGFGKIERNVAPSVMQNITEFRSLCPVSAVCMRMKVR